jgi:4-diphosphocytidyl-2-C-methyl-D-erythritol kinase
VSERRAAPPLVEFAAAKVNLTLRVLHRRPDGYHELESLVAFADIGDRLTLRPGGTLALTVGGPGADAAGPAGDNLVLKAANALSLQAEGLTLGRFRLTKRLPAAAGLGGGSADAAAALRLLAQVNGFASDDPRVMAAAAATGADVPVCLASRPRLMRGIGEILDDPFDLAPLPVVLANPGVAVATRDVFAALHRHTSTAHAGESGDPLAVSGFSAFRGRTELIDGLLACGNDLEAPAVRLQPIIADVLAALRRDPACRLARMSGSGATCFGVFDSADAARAVARRLRTAHPFWWVYAAMLGANLSAAKP